MILNQLSKSKKITMMQQLILVIFLYLAIDSRVDSSQDVMKDLTIQFTKALGKCKKELEVPDDMMSDFTNFWKEDYQLVNRQTGCMIMCLSTMLDLVDPESNLHHGNAVEFAKKHGADEQKAHQLVGIIKTCETTSPPNDDVCLKILEVAKCFKAEIHKLDWAPDMDLIVGEFLAEG